jgi:phosphoserine aminotransferase
MLCVHDLVHALEWVEQSGGAKAMKARADANLATLDRFVQ